MHRLRLLRPGPVGQRLLRDHDVGVAREARDRLVGDRHSGDSRALELVPQHGGTHCRGAHAGVTGEDDLRDGPGGHCGAATFCSRGGLAVIRGSTRRARKPGESRGGLALIGLGLGDCLGEAVLLGRSVTLPAGEQDDRADGEGDSGGEHHGEDDPQVVSRGGVADHGDDRARCRRAPEPRAEEHVGRDASGTTGDDGQQQGGLHQHIGEVDLVDAADELDQRRARGRRPCRADAEDSERQQHAQTGAGVRLEEEQDGLAFRGGFGDPQRREHTVIDGVVQEEHLRGLYEYRGQRQQLGIDEPLHCGPQDLHQTVDHRRHQIEAADREDESGDARGEHVDQHLEAGFDLALPQAVEPFHDPGGKRPHDHRADEHMHRLQRILPLGERRVELVDEEVRASDDAHDRDGRHHAPSGLIDHPAALHGDQQREQVVDDREDHRFQALVGHEPVRDEEGGDDAPRDEGGDVRHDHPREERAEFLDSDPQTAAGPGGFRRGIHDSAFRL